MLDPLVSVIMPVYNCERFVKEAITSIIEQTYTHFELLIIDDASTDTTTTIIRAFNDSRIKFIEKPKNTGYTHSLNYGLSIANGLYIARMDGDDVSLPERFAKQVAFLESHPDVVVCGTNYMFMESHVLKLQPETHEDIKIELLKNTCFGHPTVMMRKEILDKHHFKYDLEKEPAEDYDLWVRLLEFGKLYNLQDVLLYFRVHDGQVSQKRREAQLKSKLSTRIKILEYLVSDFNAMEYSVLEKVLSENILSFDEILEFLKLKNRLIYTNIEVLFFKQSALEAYLYDLQRHVVMQYFLIRNQFIPATYIQYIKIKKRLDFRLPLKIEFIVLIKSLIFFRTKKYSG